MRELKTKLILEEPIDEVIKPIIKEDVEDDIEKQTSDVKVDTTEPLNPPQTNNEFGVSSLLNASIIDEFEAIDGYNSQIATVKDVLSKEKDEKKIEYYTSIIEILTEIVNEENIHVGQLQRALSLVSPNASLITDGEVKTVENK